MEYTKQYYKNQPQANKYFIEKDNGNDNIDDVANSFNQFFVNVGPELDLVKVMINYWREIPTQCFSKQQRRKIYWILLQNIKTKSLLILMTLT